MESSKPSLKHRLLARPTEALSAWLLSGRRSKATDMQNQLVESLLAVMPSTLEEGAVELAIVEGALAISLADNTFAQEEWELFKTILARLTLSAEQLKAISLQGEPDLKDIARRLSDLQSPSYRQKIARCYCLFAAVDGSGNVNETATLRTLLKALNCSEIEDELPGLRTSFLHRETWFERQCGDLGESLVRRRAKQ